MLELAEIKPGDKVLEVGAGSGYAAAVMSRMANKVFAIERHEELAKLARARLKRLGYANAEIIIADGTKGLPEEAPFQAIIVSAGGPHVPETLKQQLAIGGRLIIPIGTIRLSDADARSPHRQGQLRGGGFRRRGLRAADRGGRLGRARARAGQGSAGGRRALRLCRRAAPARRSARLPSTIA